MSSRKEQNTLSSWKPIASRPTKLISRCRMPLLQPIRNYAMNVQRSSMVTLTHFVPTMNKPICAKIYHNASRKCILPKRKEVNHEYVQASAQGSSSIESGIPSRFDIHRAVFLYDSHTYA